MSCVRGNHCELQKLAFDYEVDEERFKGDDWAYPVDDKSAYIVRDNSKCIQCMPDGKRRRGDRLPEGAGQRQAAVADGDTGCASFPEAALGQDLPHLEQRRYRVDQA